MASNHLKFPPHLIDTVDNVIDMPNNVHDNNDNDALAHIDPDRYIDKKHNCNNYTIIIIILFFGGDLTRNDPSCSNKYIFFDYVK